MKGRAVALGLATLLVVAGCSRVANILPPLPDLPLPDFSPTPTPGQPGVLNVDSPIDGGTRGRVIEGSEDLGQCIASLQVARIEFTPVADEVRAETCFLSQAGTLGPDWGVVSRMAPSRPLMTCRLAAAVSVWRRQSVEPAAREILGAEVAQIDHMGTYACRSVNNQAGGRPSAHSRAAAIDVAGVRLSDGRRISVTDDWNADTPEGRYLRRIRDDACRIFGTTLSPDYNALHHDHLHLEAEPGWRLCS